MTQSTFHPRLSTPSPRIAALQITMPSLVRGLLHKRDELNSNDSSAQKPVANPVPSSLPPPGITLLRSDTLSQEVIDPPAFAFENHPPSHSIDSDRPTSSTSRRSFQFLHRSSRSPSLSSPSPPRNRNRLSSFLHLDNRSRSNSRDSSSNIPADLPQIADDLGADKQDSEAQWEKRATVLVQHSSQQFGRPGSSSPRLSDGDLSLQVGETGRSRSSSRSQAVDEQDDVSHSGIADETWLLMIYLGQYPRGDSTT